MCITAMTADLLYIVKQLIYFIGLEQKKCKCNVRNVKLHNDCIIIVSENVNFLSLSLIQCFK